MEFEMPEVPDAGCCGYYGPPGSFDCICGPTEAALRAWRDGRLTRPMTDEQRTWCLDHVGRVEGHDRADHERDGDAPLAGAVMSAWADFCRDKGLP